MSPGVARTLETLLVPGCFPEGEAIGTSKEGQERHWRKVREGMCQERPVSGLAGAMWGSQLEGQDRDRQQGAPMRKPGRGSVISRMLLCSMLGPSLCLLRKKEL